MKIISLHAREILDSRGAPTVEARLETSNGFFIASCPSGTSTGKNEAFELRDRENRYFGKGVLKAVKNIEEVIFPQIQYKDFVSQKQVDDFLITIDGTANKANLGANAILPVSMAFCRAFACEKEQELFEFIQEIQGTEFLENSNSRNSVPSATSSAFSMPVPCFNLIEGGRHAGNDLEVQEFMAISFLDSFSENLRAGSEIYYYLKLALVKNFGDMAMNTGYESGFAPAFKKAEQALDFLVQAIANAEYKDKIKIGLDIAASELLYKDRYKINGKNQKPKKLLDYYKKLCQKYPILFLEDPFAENDIASWSLLNDLLMVGDDLTVTNPKMIAMAQEQKLCNGVIIKLNQIGTVTEAINAVNLAKSYGWKIIVSHRSGETCDDFIADFSVGLGADFIKTGAPAGGERVAKYNRLLEIESCRHRVSTAIEI